MKAFREYASTCPHAKYYSLWKSKSCQKGIDQTTAPCGYEKASNMFNATNESQGMNREWETDRKMDKNDRIKT